MAANGAARKGELTHTPPSLLNHSHLAAPAAPAASSNRLVPIEVVKEALGEKAKKPVTIHLKKAAPKASIPGNWKESEAISTYCLHTLSH